MTATRRIFKHTLDVTDEQPLTLPTGSQFLDVQMQHGEPQLWVLVYPDNPIEHRIVRVIGTGNPIPDVPLGEYVGTTQDGSLVWHVFVSAPVLVE